MAERHSAPHRSRPAGARPGLKALLLVLVLAAGLLGAGYLAMRLARARSNYHALALVELTVPAAVLSATRPAGDPWAAARAYLHRQVSQAKASEVLAAAAADPRVAGTSWARDHAGRVPQALDDAVEASLVPETSFVRIAMAGRDAVETAGIVNAVADAYVAHLAGAAPRPGGPPVADLRNEISAVETELGGVRKRMGELFRLREDQEGALEVKIAMALRRVERARAAKKKAEAELAEAGKAAGDDPVVAAGLPAFRQAAIDAADRLDKETAALKVLQEQAEERQSVEEQIETLSLKAARLETGLRALKRRLADAAPPSARPAPGSRRAPAVVASYAEPSR